MLVFSNLDSLLNFRNSLSPHLLGRYSRGNERQRMVAWLLAVSFILIFAGCKKNSYSLTYGKPGKIWILEQGKSVERELKGSESHSYQIALSQGQFLHAVVDQRGLNVVLKLFDPGGKQICEINSLSNTAGGDIGIEPISFIAEMSGVYRLDVSPEKALPTSGRYLIKIEDLRQATPKDTNIIIAQKVFTEAEQLRSVETDESLQGAIKKYEAALELYRAVPDNHGEAQTLTNIGIALLSLGENQKSFDYLGQALPIWRSLGDRAGEAISLTYMGQANWGLGENQKALDYYHQSLPIWQALSGRDGEAVTLNNIGSVYWALGEYQKALDYYDQSLPLLQAVGDQKTESDTVHNIGSTYEYLGDYQKALDYYNQALELSRNLGDRSGEAHTLSMIGSVYNFLGENQKALDFYNQSLLLLRNLGNRRVEALALDGVAKAYSRLGDNQKALDFYNQALLLHRAVGNRIGEAYALTGIGNVYFSLKEDQKALNYLGQASSLSHTLADQYIEAEALYGIACVERNRRNLSKARTLIEKVINIVEMSRTNVDSEELRASYFASLQDYFEFYIDLLMELNHLSPSASHLATALNVNERTRARSLIESLAEANADIHQGIDSNLLEHEQSLQKQLYTKVQNYLYLLKSEHNPEQEKIAKKEIEELRHQLNQSEAKIRENSPIYAALKYPEPLNLQQIQQQVLDENTLLLEYALGQKRSYLWAVTRSSVKGFELPKRAEIEEAARHLYSLITARGRHEPFETEEERGVRVAKADAEYSEAAAKLSEMVLGPVASQLGKKRLLIVADGTLHYVPFAALPVPPNRKENTKSVPLGRSNDSAVPLLIEHEIVCLPSATSLAVLRHRIVDRRPVDKMIAVLADPVFDKDDERVRAIKVKCNNDTGRGPALSERLLKDRVQKAAVDLGVTRSGIGFPRLLFTRQEAETIKSVVPDSKCKVALDFEASLKTATDAEMSQYRIIHFATHGLLDSVHPQFSGLVLSLFNQKGEEQPGILTTNEVFNLNLSADLVVLSACSTGLGKEIRGEGLVGLMQGFMYAGAARVIVTLWNVNDKATSELMGRFYKKFLSEQKPPAKALKEAQIEMWQQQQWKSPYYWAGFVIQGEYN